MRKLIKEAKSAANENKAFCRARHLIQGKIFSEVSKFLSGTNTNLRTCIVNCTLSSASLMANYYKHLLLRNSETFNPSYIRKIMSVLDPKNFIWKYNYDQLQVKKPQYEAAIKKLIFNKKCLESKLKPFNEEIEEHGESFVSINRGSLLKTEEMINKMTIITEYLQPIIHGSMHPDPGAFFSIQETNNKNKKESNSKPEVENNLLVGPNSPWRIRGMMIRVTGATKGQRAQSWKKYIGSYSINSVNFVNAEESKVQLFTKHGTFGLTIRIVWEKISDMPQMTKLSFDGVNYYDPFKYD